MCEKSANMYERYKNINLNKHNGLMSECNRT